MAEAKDGQALLESAKYKDSDPPLKCGYTVEALDDMTPGEASCQLSKKPIWSQQSDMVQDLTEKEKGSNF